MPTTLFTVLFNLEMHFRIVFQRNFIEKNKHRCRNRDMLLDNHIIEWNIYTFGNYYQNELLVGVRRFYKN